MEITVLILAGGASSRMGGLRDKLLKPVDGVPLIRHRTQAALASAISSRIRVVTSPEHPKRHQAIADLPVETALNDGAEAGIAHSLIRGLEGLDCDAVLVLLADLPDIEAEHIRRVWRHACDQPSALITRGATAQGKPGHPVVIRAALFEELRALRGDQGAAPVLQRHRAQTTLVPLPGEVALNDLDTPEDWARWKAQRQHK